MNISFILDLRRSLVDFPCMPSFYGVVFYMLFQFAPIKIFIIIILYI